MKLGTKGRYAVMAMVDLASRVQDGPVSLADVATRQDISLSYLEQLFAKLRKADLVKSIRGPGGGYVLSIPAERIMISSIVLAVDEPLDVTRCGQKEQGCMSGGERCVTHDLWTALTLEIYNFLDRVSLADVITRNLQHLLRANTAQTAMKMAAFASNKETAA